MNIGKIAKVTFISLGKTVEGKVDTGATFSSLHANNINVQGDKVTFTSEVLKPGQKFAIDLVRLDKVNSADGGEQERPVINMDVEIDGILLKGVDFNLTDRSNMDLPVLIGENILKAGNFVVDVSESLEDNQETVIDVQDSLEDEKLYVNYSPKIIKEQVENPDREFEELDEPSKIIFKVGGYYRHSSGEDLHIIGGGFTTMYGYCLFGESSNYSDIKPVGQTEDNTEGWIEISEEEWMKNFS